MAIKCKMFEVAKSKNIKGVHIINIIKQACKRKPCYLTSGSKHAKTRKLNKGLMASQAHDLHNGSDSSSHYRIPRFLRL